MPRALLRAASLLGILAASPAQASASDIATGRDLAARLCAICHMNPGQGEKTAPNTIPGFWAVANRPGQTLEGIVAWLRAVPPQMPNHHLTQEEMHALAQYIVSLRPAR